MKTFEAVFEYRIKDDHGSRFAHACVRVEAKDDTDAERKISELLQRAVGEPVTDGVDCKKTVFERARAYVQAMPPSDAGHAALLDVARVLVRGFALSDTQALNILLEYNDRCVPRWTHQELRQKLADARGETHGVTSRGAGEETVAPDPLVAARGAQIEKLRDALAKIRLLTKPHGRDEIYDPSMCIGCIADGALLSLEKA